MDSAMLEESLLDKGAHWRQLANTTEPSLCGGVMRPHVKLL